MPDFLTQDVELFISATRESAFNTPITTGTDYLRATTQSPTVYIPEPEFTNDANRAGNASEFPTGRCLKRFLSPTIGITDRASFDLYGRLAMRCVGGAPLAPVEVTGGANLGFQHAANMLPKSAGLQLPSMNAITATGGASFLWTGVVVNDFTLSQNADEDMQVAFTLIGSGKHRSPHLVGVQQVETNTVIVTSVTVGNAKAVVTAAGMTGSPKTVTFAVANSDTDAQVAGKARVALAADPTVSGFFAVSGASTAVILTARHTAPNDTTMNLEISNDTSSGITTTNSANTTAGSYTLPSAPGFACLDTKPFLQYNDGVLQDLTIGCRWRNWSVSINNNHNPQRDRCGSDPRQKRGDYTSTTPPGVGAYLQKLTRNPRAVTAEITYLVNENLREWEQLCDNVQMTGVTFGARGAQLDDSPLIYEALKVVIPKAKFGVIRGADSDGFAAFTLSFETEFDATAIGARVEVINADDGVSPVFS